MNRRDFVLKTSMATLSSLALMKCKAQEMSGLNNIGIQLYTVRDEMAKDAKATLKAIADMGYAHIENAGYSEGKYYGMSRKEFKSYISDLGLNMYSGHTMTGKHAPDQTHTMINKWELACEDAAEIGQEYIVCAYLLDFERVTIDDYKKVADLLNKCGETANKFGVKMAYHNHDFEFMPIQGVVPYDIMMNETESNLVSYELDLFWTRKAGVEALEYFKKYQGRYHLWHIKDMNNDEEKFFAEVGQGVIDWKKYFNQKDKSGMKFFFVEQDQCREHKPLESVKISYDFLSHFSV